MNEDSFCRQCHKRNTLLVGVCCSCKYNSEEDRPATEEELEKVGRMLDEANKALQEVIDAWELS